MLDAIKKDNARYASFARDMLAALAAEEADIANRDKNTWLTWAGKPSNGETARPAGR